MNISQYNYEAYFLDYYEGRLDAEATRELMDFLAQHPELKQEFESFEAVTLNDIEEVTFENKESLKKFVAPVNASNFDEIAIEYVEGTLNPAMNDELLTFLKLYPQYENELATYKLTKLRPDTSIFFEDKDSLKRKGRRVAAYYYWSAAASVAIIIAGYFILNKPPQPIVTITNANRPIDTTHTAIKQSTANVTIAQHTVAPVKTFVIKKQYHQSQNVNNSEPVVTVVKQNNVIQKPEPVINPMQRDTAIAPEHIAFDAPKDSINKSVYVQHDSFIKYGNKLDSTNEQEKHSVFAFASNAVKSIGRIFKRGGVGFHKYYSPEDSNKVIAYQFTLGDNRYTLAKK